MSSEQKLMMEPEEGTALGIDRGGRDGGGDDNEEVTFADDEGEVFDTGPADVMQATEVVFDDDTDGEVFTSAEAQESIRETKAECAELAVEAGDNSAYLWIAAAGLGLASEVITPLPAAYAGAAAASQSLAAGRAQECANDPPREDIASVTLYRPAPIGQPANTSSFEAAAFALATSSIQLSRALKAVTTTIERYHHAAEVLADDQKHPRARQWLLMQSAALVHNCCFVAAHLRSIRTALRNTQRRLDKTYDIAELAGKLASASTEEILRSHGQSRKIARTAYNQRRIPNTLTSVDEEWAKFRAHIESGNVTARSMSSDLKGRSTSVDRFIASHESFQKLVNTFGHVGEG